MPAHSNIFALIHRRGLKFATSECKRHFEQRRMILCDCKDDCGHQWKF